MIECGLLNRLRGTGVIFSISKLQVTGTMIYSLYIGIVFGLISCWYIGLLSVGLFLLAESMGWGKWVGALCYPETKTNLEKEYQDKEGYGFPFIHYIANFIIPEKKEFFKYCNVALGLRGLLWGLILFIGLFTYGTINYIEYISISILYAIGFPLSCYLSRLKSFNYKNKFVSIVGKWETMEVYYGFFHGIAIWYIVLKGI